MEKKTMGKFISVLRRANGMTQKELGEKLFVSDKTVSRWECDECTPELSLLPAIAEIFGVTTDELLRGERNHPDAVDHPEKKEYQKARSSKQFKLMIRERQKKFGNLSYISIGLIIAGLAAAVLCDLCFYRGLLGFCLASAIFAVAVICQVCFTSNALLSVEEEEIEYAEKIKKADTDTVIKSIKIFFVVWLSWVFCFPIAVLPPDIHYGLTFGSWIRYGLPLVVIAFVCGYVVYKLLILRILIRKNIVFLTELELARMKQSARCLQKVVFVFVIVFIVLSVGMAIVSMIYENDGFLDEKFFTDPDEFVRYVQDQYDQWYEEGYGDLPEGGFRKENADAYASICWGEIAGKDYYYNKNFYSVFDVFCYDSDRYDIKVVSYEALYDEQDCYDTIMITLTILHCMNFISCVGWYCMGARRRNFAER